MTSLLTTRRAEISALCEQFNVRRLDVFGSAARGSDFTAASDLDYLVEFEPGHVASLTDYMGLRDALAALFGREVDLTMAGAVRNPYVRAAIERSREPLCGA